jgi:hypothetical protein
MSAHSFLRRSSLALRRRSTSAQMSSPKRAKSSAIRVGLRVVPFERPVVRQALAQQCSVSGVVGPSHDRLRGLAMRRRSEPLEARGEKGRVGVVELLGQEPPTRLHTADRPMRVLDLLERFRLVRPPNDERLRSHAAKLPRHPDAMLPLLRLKRRVPFTQRSHVSVRWRKIARGFTWLFSPLPRALSAVAPVFGLRSRSYPRSPGHPDCNSSSSILALESRAAVSLPAPEHALGRRAGTALAIAPIWRYFRVLLFSFA